MEDMIWKETYKALIKDHTKEELIASYWFIRQNCPGVNDGNTEAMLLDAIRNKH